MSNKPKTRSTATAFFIFVLICLWSTKGLAQKNKVNIDALTSETQKSSPQADKMTLVWWIPGEFWQASLGEDPSLTPTQVADFVKILSPYNIFVVADGKIGSFGGITYRSEEEIRNSIQLVDKAGNKYSPMSGDKVDADAKNLLAMLKPVLGNMLGSIGQNLHFYVFPTKNKEGAILMEAKKEGSFTFKLGGSEFKWKLPIGSLLPLKTCPVDGEELNGAWKYCPWHGTVLKEPK